MRWPTFFIYLLTDARCSSMMHSILTNNITYSISSANRGGSMLHYRPDLSIFGIEPKLVRNLIKTSIFCWRDRSEIEGESHWPAQRLRCTVRKTYGKKACWRSKTRKYNSENVKVLNHKKVPALDKSESSVAPPSPPYAPRDLPSKPAKEPVASSWTQLVAHFSDVRGEKLRKESGVTCILQLRKSMNVIE
ncbi:unnamed protein product [Nesidiocoris tenuis]|uniref:Uncharacterized protein n=1 Tax=Nesidiocoris tenuis TaxID=355587 RepID=A0A6H5GG69_9HEMI|nr:unnamed protein product [Nesidiocoris tenuis]